MANRDNVRLALQGELADIKAKRDLQNNELQVLALIAQGRNDEADALQRAMQIQQDIKAIQEQLKIGEQEAIGQVEQRARLEKQIALDKLNQQAQDLQDAQVRKLAEKDIHEARNADEKARIRRARKVQNLEEDIVALREKGTDQANRMADDLEKKKQGFLEVVLDDQTKEDIKQIENKKLEVEKGFNDQIDALNKRMKEIQKAELDAQQAEQERLRKVQQKQTELLKKAREAEEQLIKQVAGVGDKAKDKLQKGFNAVIQKLNLFKAPEINIESSDFDLSGISDVLSEIPSQLANIKIPEFPKMPEIKTPEVTVEVDTDSLLTEKTGTAIKTALEGKFVNQ